MTRFETTDELLDGILEGKVPRQVRLFAAQGLLPIPREDLLRLQVMLSTDPDDELAEISKASVAEVGKTRSTQSAFARLVSMSVKDKVLCALKGTREERSILINSRSRLVVRGVLGSPKLNESEVERFAGLRTVDADVLRIIYRHPRWMRRYQVVWQLVSNPKTPVELGMRLVNRLNVRDLKRLSGSRNINPVIRRTAVNFADRRR